MPGSQKARGFLKGLSFGRCWGVLAVAVVVLAFGAPLRAQEAGQVVVVVTVEPARLEYTAAPGCADEKTFRDAVATFLKMDPFEEKAAPLLHVKLKQVRGGFLGTVQKIPAEGAALPEEERAGPTCEDVLRDVAVLAKQRLSSLTPVVPPPEEPPPDLPALLELPAPETPPEPERAPVTASRPVTPARPAPSPQVVARTFNLCSGSKYMNLSIGLSGLVLMSVGYTDNVAPAFGLGLEFRGMPPSWNGFGLSLGVEFRGVPPSRATAREQFDPKNPTTYPQPIEVSTWSGLLVPCLRFAKYFSACAAGQLGAINMHGPTGDDNWSYTAMLGPRLGVEIPFAERFAVLGLGEVLFATAQNHLGFRDPPVGQPKANVFWSEPIVSGFIGAGVAVRFE